MNVIFKISLKVIKLFAMRASVGVSNLTIYTEYVFGIFLHSGILNCIKGILFPYYKQAIMVLLKSLSYF